MFSISHDGTKIESASIIWNIVFSKTKLRFMITLEVFHEESRRLVSFESIVSLK